MLKSEMLLFAMNDLDDSDLESARKRLGYQTGGAGVRIMKKRIITFALAAALILGLGAVAYALGWFGLRQRVTPVDSITQTMNDPGESGILSRSAYNNEPAGQAHAAWIAYMNEHRNTYTNLSNDDAGNWHPDDPELQKLQPIYGAFDEEALDKLLAIRDEYGVTLHTELVIPPTTALFLRVTGLEPFMRSENGMDGWPTAYVYEDGSYHAEGGRAELADGSVLLYTVDCGRRGTLDPAYLPVFHLEEYAEREYVNAGGDTVVLSVAEGKGCFIFYDSEDYLVTVRSDSENAEALADCFDFAAMVRLNPDLSAVQNTVPTAVKPKTGLMTLSDFAQTEEYLASSAFQTLFNDYYLPIANERLAQMNSRHPEGYSQLYYYGSFPTGIPEIDDGLADILAERPLRSPGKANIIWHRLPFHEGGVYPDGGMEANAYERAMAEGELSEEACFDAFGMGVFLTDAELETVIVWENGTRYCEYRIGNLSGILHYIPKGCFYPLFHPILKPDAGGWAYDTACGEQVFISAVTEVSYPDMQTGYVLYETDTAYVIITGSTEPFALELLADAVDFTCFS
jgi:hypothetical protein